MHLDDFGVPTRQGNWILLYGCVWEFPLNFTDRLVEVILTETANLIKRQFLPKDYWFITTSVDL
jgi:hypothetical protein